MSIQQLPALAASAMWQRWKHLQRRDWQPSTAVRVRKARAMIPLYNDVLWHPLTDVVFTDVLCETLEICMERFLKHLHTHKEVFSLLRKDHCRFVLHKPENEARG